MIAKIVALSLIPAGAAALGVVGYMQHQPRAFTTAEDVSQVAVVRSIAPKPQLAAPAVEPEELELEALLVKPAPKPRVQVKKAEKAEMPCSGWRALGYERVDNGNASGVSRVRELCDPNTKP